MVCLSKRSQIFRLLLPIFYIMMKKNEVSDEVLSIISVIRKIISSNEQITLNFHYSLQN